MDYIVTVTTGSEDPQICAATRDAQREVARALQAEGRLHSFTAVRRDRAEKVDFYLYETSLGAEEIRRAFGGADVEVHAMHETTADGVLVRLAGEVTEVLLTRYADEHSRFASLRAELLHHIFNGLGEGYVTESLFYLESAVEAASRQDPEFAEKLDEAIEPTLKEYFAYVDGADDSAQV
jgi:hypothetical protein